MKGFAKTAPRRVAETRAVAEKQKYPAVPYEDERDIGKAGQIVVSHLHFKTETECFGTLIKTKT
jgi:hypothetical protein